MTTRRGFLSALLALPVVAWLLPKRTGWVKGDLVMGRPLVVPLDHQNYVKVREFYDNRTGQGWRQVGNGPREDFRFHYGGGHS